MACLSPYLTQLVNHEKRIRGHQVLHGPYNLFTEKGLTLNIKESMDYRENMHKWHGLKSLPVKIGGQTCDQNKIQPLTIDSYANTRHCGFEIGKLFPGLLSLPVRISLAKTEILSES